MNEFNFNVAAPSNTQTDGTQSISTSDFWPTVDLDQLRQDMRIDTTITPNRLYHTAIDAVAYVNDQLSSLISDGISHISQTDPRQINNQNLAEIRYLRAVACYTKALLLETYSDYDATGKTGDRAAAKNETAEDYRREGHHAIAELLRRPRIDCELV